MKKQTKKILFIPGDKFSLEFMNEWLHIFTLNNGQYPDEIHMTKDGLQHFESILFKPFVNSKIKKPRFNGVPIKINANNHNFTR